MALLLSNVRPTAPTTRTGTGSFLFDLSGLVGMARVIVYSFAGPGGAAVQLFSQDTPVPIVDFMVPGLPSGNYDVGAYNLADFSEHSGFIYSIPAYVPTPKGGCTDPLANNTDNAATYEDGTCAYTPRAVAPVVFDVPLLGSLRFVQPLIVDNCSTFETPDNTLFCQQERPGMQRRPLYFQPVCYCDPVRVQVLTNLLNVEAVLHRHRDGVVVPAPGAAQLLTKVQALDGDAPFFQVELSSAGDGNTYLISATGGLPASLLAAGRLALRLTPGGPVLNYRVLRSGRASATVNDDFLVINRPWSQPPAGTDAAVSWALSGPGFNVWEAALDLSALDPGEYEVRLHGYDDANRSAAAISEPISLAAAHANTVVLDYGNIDNAYGMVFNTGIRPRLRVRGTYFRPSNGGTLTEHRNSDNTPELLASTATRLRLLEVYDAPVWQHEKIFLLCRLDVLRVNGQLGYASAAYETTEVRSFPLTSGRVAIEQKQWLGAGNSDDTGANDTGDNFLVLRTGGFLKLRRG